jgi:type I restriction enzyme M protein
MLDKEIKQRINTARQILVGKVPDPKAQVEQITTALIYKFMDDMDRENEELGGSAQFLTGELKEYAWGRLMSRELSGMERWELYTRALDTFSKSQQIPELFRRIFKGAYLPYRDAETLNLFLKEINAFSYDNSENLGNAYEYLLSILGSQGDAGQFRTPRHIIDFIVEVVNPQKTDRILDPACGTAGFLISSYKHILRVNSSNYDAETYIPAFAKTSSPDSFSTEIQQNGKYDGMNLTPDDRKRIAKNMEGYDISPDMVRLSLVNMYLHNFPAPKIAEYDTLSYEDCWNEQFDVILANPPFMTPKGGIRPHKRFRVSANRAEVLFVDYIAEHLSQNGRAGVIVPEGIIFQTANAYKQLRKMLVEDDLLYAVVSLPAGVFQPYSGVKTSILFMDRELAKRKKEIVFVKVENDGFDLGAQRRRIDKNDLGPAFNILKDWQAGKKPESPLALSVEKSKLAENREYNLTGDRYREAMDYSRVKWPIVEIGEICEVISGQSPEGKYYNEKGEGIPFYQGKTEFTDKYLSSPKKWTTQITRLAKKNDILMSVRAPVGPVNISKEEICIGRGLAAIRTSDNIMVDYLFNLLLGMQDEIKGNGGAVFDSINRKDIEKIKIPLPPLDVQKALVAELDGYQKIIDGARQVLDNWKPQISIDPDWPKVKLGEVFSEIKNGKNVNQNENGKYRVSRIQTISDGVVNLDKTKWTNDDVNEKDFLEFGDILLSHINSIDHLGKTAIFIENEKLIHGINLIKLRPIKDKINPFYAIYNFKSDQFIQEIRKYAQRAVNQASVKTTDIKNITIPLPQIETQNQIVADIEAEQQMVDNNKKLITLYEQKIKDKVKEVWGE